VVTAFYHMPRALTELRRSLPDVLLYAYPVLSPGGFGAERLVGLRLLAEEYSKYLLAAAGVSGWGPPGWGLPGWEPERERRHVGRPSGNSPSGNS
jgi:uncharacterized SAM-binding protein YcdF (DUF218 family)